MMPLTPEWNTQLAGSTKLRSAWRRAPRPCQLLRQWEPCPADPCTRHCLAGSVNQIYILSSGILLKTPPKLLLYLIFTLAIPRDITTNLKLFFPSLFTFLCIVFLWCLFSYVCCSCKWLCIMFRFKLFRFRVFPLFQTSQLLCDSAVWFVGLLLRYSVLYLLGSFPWKALRWR